ncbi:MAG: DNA repair exonuclease [Sulfurimonas sp.]|nr:DNA repair exonuclease [Sulfurimonas sp.]
MKILHFSDTHLGYNDLDILNGENINQREADFYDAFSQVVEQITLTKPDYIIHTGDLFHRASPSNRAITFALEQFKIIDALNIPFILIAGNHSTPRTNLSSPILKIFENFKNIYVSYEQKYKKIEFDDIVFHTLPHMNDDSKALEQIELCEKNIDAKKKNIMMMHCSVGAHYLMQEFGEWVYPIDKEYIFKMMDYVALGHWHGFGAVSIGSGTSVPPNVYYSGSTERTSLNDKRNKKGFIELTLGSKDISGSGTSVLQRGEAKASLPGVDAGSGTSVPQRGEVETSLPGVDEGSGTSVPQLTGEVEASLPCTLEVNYKEINIRPIISKEIDCENYESSLASVDASDTKEAIVEVRLKNLTALQSIDIQNSDIKDLFADAMSVSIKRDFKRDANETDVQDVEALSLQEFFLEHIKEETDEKEYERLKGKVQELFASYEEVQDDTL